MYSGAFVRSDSVTTRAVRLSNGWSLDAADGSRLAFKHQGRVLRVLDAPSEGASLPPSQSKAADRSFSVRDGYDEVTYDAGDVVVMPAPGRAVDGESPPCELETFEAGAAYRFSHMRLSFEAAVAGSGSGAAALAEVVVRRGSPGPSVAWAPVPETSTPLAKPVGQFGLYTTPWFPIEDVKNFALRIASGAVLVGRVAVDLAF